MRRLFTAIEAAGGGNGDVQVKLNKEALTDTASILFQTGFSGRAEIGLAGGDGLSLKVSADGAAWNTALSADRCYGNRHAFRQFGGERRLGRHAYRPPEGKGKRRDRRPGRFDRCRGDGAPEYFHPSVKGLGACVWRRRVGLSSRRRRMECPSGGSGLSVSEITLDFGGAPVWSETFDAALSGAAPGQKVLISPSASMPGPLSSDELEMDGLTAFATVVSPDLVRVIAASNPGPVSGLRNFNLTLA